MDSKELMIGDFVYFDLGDDDIRKVLRVTESSTFGKVVGQSLYSRLFCEWEGKEYHPIPITEEFLKFNGFKEFTYGWGYENDFKIIIRTSYSNKKENKSLWWAVTSSLVPIKELKYVHELQHVLRLVGKQELADGLKFKTEEEK